LIRHQSTANGCEKCKKPFKTAWWWCCDRILKKWAIPFIFKSTSLLRGPVTVNKIGTPLDTSLGVAK
jgi:hypothetical protein